MLQDRINEQLIELIGEWFENNETLDREEYDDLFQEARGRLC